MWAMTSFGILMPAIRPPKTIKAGDFRTLQVRSRRSIDLDILRARYMQNSLGPTLHTPTFDYEYRAYCEPAAFALAMAQMVMEIDYLKFKPTTESKYCDAQLHSTYNGIWSVVMSRLSTKKHQTEYFGTPMTGATTRPFGGYSTPSGGSVSSSKRWEAEYETHNWEAAEFYKDAKLLEEWADAPNEGEGADFYADGPSLKQVEEGVDQLLENEDWTNLDPQKQAQIEDALSRLLEEEPPEEVEHETCPHQQDDAADLRCRKRQLREWAAGLIEIRQIAEESLSGAQADHDPTPSE